MAVPLLDLRPQYESLKSDLDAAVLRVLASGQYILGPEVAGLEGEMAELCGSRFAVGCASGTDALILILRALDIGPGDEVVTTPYTFFATASAVQRVGARAVFADIDPQTYNIDPQAVAARIGPRTRAILPVHLFGQVADMEALGRIAARAGIPVIEDACQAIGAEFRGRRAGSLGIAGAFSFFPSKNLGAIGDAGLITTGDEKLAERMRRLRVHGAGQTYFHDEVGYNSRLDALQAAVLRVKLPHLADWTERRRANAAVYAERLAGLPLGLPVERPESPSIYNQYVVRVGPRRDELAAHLKARQIGHSVYYPLPLHLQPCFADWGGQAGDLPEAERAARETLALPIHPDLSIAQLAEVAGAVAEFFRR